MCLCPGCSCLRYSKIYIGCAQHISVRRHHQYHGSDHTFFFFFTTSHRLPPSVSTSPVESALLLRDLRAANPQRPQRFPQPRVVVLRCRRPHFEVVVQRSVEHCEMALRCHGASLSAVTYSGCVSPSLLATDGLGPCRRTQSGMTENECSIPKVRARHS